MNQEKPQEVKKKKEDFLNFLQWWKIDKNELQKQTDQYNTLSLLQSARGQSMLCLLFSALCNTIFILFLKGDKLNFIDVVIFLILGFFILRGHKWAMAVVMILWTIEKSLMVFDTTMVKNISINPLIQIVWWALFMHYFYLAFRVERLRSKKD